jgi:hypothetical protein
MCPQLDSHQPEWVNSMTESEQKRRREIDRFVCYENVERFSRLLMADPDARERKMLMSLLAEEREKQTQLGN